MAAISLAISSGLQTGTNLPRRGHRTKKHQLARLSGGICRQRQQNGFSQGLVRTCVNALRLLAKCARAIAMARLLLISGNRDRLNDENDSRFHPFPSVCAETCRTRAQVGGMIARLSAMKFAEFKKAGHWPTLLAAFLYFDISFMAWVALGPLMVYIAHDMNLAVSEKFTLVAIPVLAGALLRVPMGILADIIGAKRTGMIAQLIVISGNVLGVAFRTRQQARDRDLRSRARHRRRVLCRRIAAGEPLVSAAISGRGDGHRGRRQYGRRASTRCWRRRSPSISAGRPCSVFC